MSVTEYDRKEEYPETTQGETLHAGQATDIRVCCLFVREYDTRTRRRDAIPNSLDETAEGGCNSVTAALHRREFGAESVDRLGGGRIYCISQLQALGYNVTLYSTMIISVHFANSIQFDSIRF